MHLQMLVLRKEKRMFLSTVLVMFFESTVNETNPKFLELFAGAKCSPASSVKSSDPKTPVGWAQV